MPLTVREPALEKEDQVDLPGDGAQRVIIGRVTPEIDGGRFAVKRVVGEEVRVEADIFSDGHDLLSAIVKYRHESEEAWSEGAMEPMVNDRWEAVFTVTTLGPYFYTVEAWVNHFRSWRRTIEKKYAVGQDLDVDLLGGVGFLRDAAERASGSERNELEMAVVALTESPQLPAAAKVAIVTNPQLARAVDRYGDRGHVTSYGRELRVMVDPELARFSAWYEIFPRSCSPTPGRHGTFKDLQAQIPRIARLGFDVLYLPPIHPIGRAFRKGKNNTLNPEPGDPGSPWAIGSQEGGHKSIHPELGTLTDFREMVNTAAEFKMSVALDIAFQCSPDHPYVAAHPEWFQKRADGTIQYAENPPKKYQDIYPVNFESSDWQGLWTELKSVFEFWIEQGVRVFRVDNPHTKSFRFWEWCLGGLKAKNPNLIFLSEAFTRPKVMYYLAKLGFTQSYNYFPWRNTKQELQEYLTELIQPPVSEFFRPNLWPNTPDILPESLQYGGRPAFISRLVLAATLGASYGIYGPPYEVCENTPREHGSEEYLNSEKYQLREWDFSRPDSLADLMKRLNRIRRENVALRSNESLRFHSIDNPYLLAYSKRAREDDTLILTVVNLDPHHTQNGWVDLGMTAGERPTRNSLQAHELLTDARYFWQPGANYVELNPQFAPAHIFRLRRFVRTENDFDYFL